MDYEKEYKSALERAKNIYGASECKDILCTLKTIFPELRESEDERIRRAIINYIGYGQHCGVPNIDMIAWLEKQSKDNMIEALRLEYEKGKADALQEQRKEWSEEDERIKKNIKIALLSMDDNLKDFYYTHHTSKEECLDWLEKQRYSEFELENEYWRGYDDAKFHLKEDKVTVIGAGSNSASVSDGDISVTSKEVISQPTASSTIEPKFKAGDWITNDRYTRYIVGINSKRYQFKNGTVQYCDDVDKKYHLWSIEDAKDGDVLACGDKVTDCPFIFHNLTEGLNPRSYCGVNTLCHFQDNDENGGFWCDSDEVRPATKEQRELLFQKMKEAGYEWDADKKELKKISQEYPLTPDECIKSAWNDEDERIYHSLLADIRASQNGSTNTLEPYYNEQIDWLKSLKKRIGD